MGAISFIAALGIVMTLVLAGMLLLIRRSAVRGKTSQNELMESLRQEIPDAALARIYVARPEHFRRRMKIVGFEARAVLQVTADAVKVVGVLNGGGRLERAYPRYDPALEWVGNRGIGSANLHWLSLGRGQAQLMLSADTGFVAVHSREATADLCALIDRRFSLPAEAKADFALEKNPASLALVVLFFLLLAFAFVDGVLLNPLELMTPGPILWLLPSAILLAIPAYWILARRRVPSRESLVLSLVLVLGLTCAMVPAVKRLDQLLAPDPVPYEYRLVDAARLEPLQPGPPGLRFSRYKEYWAQFEKGSLHRFNFIHGPLGLWQLDHRELDEPIRRFYEGRK